MTRSKKISQQGVQRSLYGGIVSASLSRGASAPPLTSLTSEEISRKCERVLSEIARCEDREGKYIESSALHGTLQTFVPSELRGELDLELDRLLTEQILREERLLNAPRLPSADVVKLTTTAGECLACGGPCGWTPLCDANALAKRRKQLHRELKLAERRRDANTNAPKTMRSVVARSALNGGEVTFVCRELINELSDEIQQIGTLLKLALIDDELHRTYASTDRLVSISSIHGYPTTVKQQSAIWALEHEHNRHIAKIAALETIDNILEWYDLHK